MQPKNPKINKNIAIIALLFYPDPGLRLHASVKVVILCLNKSVPAKVLKKMFSCNKFENIIVRWRRVGQHRPHIPTIRRSAYLQPAKIVHHE